MSEMFLANCFATFGSESAVKKHQKQAQADILFRQAREEARKQAIKEAVELYRRYPRVIKGVDLPHLDVHLSLEDLERLSKENSK